MSSSMCPTMAHTPSVHSQAGGRAGVSPWWRRGRRCQRRSSPCLPAGGPRWRRCSPGWASGASWSRPGPGPDTHHSYRLVTVPQLQTVNSTTVTDWLQYHKYRLVTVPQLHTGYSTTVTDWLQYHSYSTTVTDWLQYHSYRLVTASQFQTGYSTTVTVFLLYLRSLKNNYCFCWSKNWNYAKADQKFRTEYTVNCISVQILYIPVHTSTLFSKVWRCRTHITWVTFGYYMYWVSL